MRLGLLGWGRWSARRRCFNARDRLPYRNEVDGLTIGTRTIRQLGFSSIEGILSESVGVYDLTKRQAGTVIDELTGNDAAATGRNRR
ncbi:MAG: hypothetical protein DWQ42_15790 [Planctomycetota bacterium]|nr:MAG: hypothetical protein DWQ42_15790 [Planctomycetota bacterium]REK49371.1 MAG: hypothetical protein DWQ46_00470 [Planctomycetota bacterium]